MIEKTAVDAVVTRLQGYEPEIRNSDNPTYNQSPAVKVMNSVLSLGISYKNVVKPRLKDFAKNRPDVRQVTELAAFIAGYRKPIDFLTQELNYNHKPKNIMKANAINSVAKKLCGIIEASPTVTQEGAIRQWAIAAKPQDCYSSEWNIKGFQISGIQWLRMLFGAETVKPDRHIKRFLHDTLNRKISDEDSVLLIEEASTDLGLSVRKVDSFIWNMMSNWRAVRLAPDVADAFPTDISVNEALRSLLKQ